MLTAVAITTLCVPTGVRAQFAIDKTELVLHQDGPVRVSGVLLVRNEGTQRAQAVLRIEDWDRAPDGTNRFYQPGTLARSCAPRLEVFPRTLSLAPGESYAVRIDLAPDSVASLVRECWSAVLVEAVQPRVEANGRTLLYTIRTGLKVYALPSTAALDGDVEDLAIFPVAQDVPTVGIAMPVPTQARVQFRNTGERHVITRGWIEVRAEDERLVATVPLPPLYALPQAVMQTTVVLPPLAAGRYHLLAVVDYGGDALAAAQRDHVVP